MKLLLTNDDGIESEGILVLARRLSALGHNVTIVAPAQNQSAKSHSLTLHTLQSLKRLSPEGEIEKYAFSGTPADCVQFALSYLKLQPDAILSGINDGMNLGSDIFYSGTVGAAMEGTFQKIPSLALSAFHRNGKRCKDFAFAADYIAERLEAYLSRIKPGITLNINIPAEEEWCGKEKYCMAGVSNYSMYHVEENGMFSLRGEHIDLSDSPAGYDLYYARLGYVTVTPLRMDFNDYAALEEWKK